ncbi:unnamed protein product [Litomosoides sigmodontis]|uniref:Uncharacterized protein n=1 Tax=Litomosoides sigmodontis TaxID=42156 RepID=A0A3P6SDL9_LITSI|nr:unnamed protein product [Litomosoides sigmodontis]
MCASEESQYQQQQRQKQQPNACFPTCKTPDKRDFMDPNPPRTADDFYRYYDPWIGIGTAMILTLFFILIALKTFITWLLRRITVWRYRYQNCREGQQKTSTNHSNKSATTQIMNNGHIVVN